jgi:hypothetical protein
LPLSKSHFTISILRFLFQHYCCCRSHCRGALPLHHRLSLGQQRRLVQRPWVLQLLPSGLLMLTSGLAAWARPPALERARAPWQQLSAPACLQWLSQAPRRSPPCDQQPSHELAPPVDEAFQRHEPSRTQKACSSRRPWPWATPAMPRPRPRRCCYRQEKHCERALLRQHPFGAGGWRSSMALLCLMVTLPLRQWGRQPEPPQSQATTPAAEPRPAAACRCHDPVSLVDLQQYRRAEQRTRAAEWAFQRRLLRLVWREKRPCRAGDREAPARQSSERQPLRLVVGRTEERERR